MTMDSEIVLPLGWTKCTLREVTLPVSKIDPRNDPGRRIDYIDISSIDNVRHVVEHAKSYRLSDAPSRARQLVHAGDVLFATVRPYLRNIARVSAEYDRQIASTGFSVLRAAIGIVPEFLFYKAISDDFVDALARKQYGVSYPAIKDDDVRDQVLSLPPTTEQRRIVAKIEELFSELDNGVAMLKTAREQLGTYRQAVLTRAFEGKITTQWREKNNDKLENRDQLLGRIRHELGTHYQRKVQEWETACKARDQRDNQSDRPRNPKKPPTLGQNIYGTKSTLPSLPESWIWGKISWMTLGVEYGTATKSAPSGDVAVLRMGNIQDAKLDWSDLVYTSNPKEIDRYLLKDGDVLFNRTNSPELVRSSSGLNRSQLLSIAIFDAIRKG